MATLEQENRRLHRDLARALSLLERWVRSTQKPNRVLIEDTPSFNLKTLNHALPYQRNNARKIQAVPKRRNNV